MHFSLSHLQWKLRIPQIRQGCSAQNVSPSLSVDALESSKIIPVKTSNPPLKLHSALILRKVPQMETEINTRSWPGLILAIRLIKSINSLAWQDYLQK